MQLEGQAALWLSAQPCAPRELGASDRNHEHVAYIVQTCGGFLGVPLIAWLSPAPAPDADAVMVWIRGGPVGRLSVLGATYWRGMIVDLHRQTRLPIACAAHVQLPPEGSTETHEVVVWLPPHSLETSTGLSAQDMAAFVARAQAEPTARAERWRARQAAQAQRVANLESRFGQENAARIAAEELWIGASEEMVLEMHGEPTKVEEKVLKAKTKRKFSYAGPCAKCDGTGEIPEFSHVDDGKCFSCNGTGLGKSAVLRVHFENGAVVGWDKK